LRATTISIQYFPRVVNLFLNTLQTQIKYHERTRATTSYSVSNSERLARGAGGWWSTQGENARLDWRYGYATLALETGKMADME
jgi:hypothetical protein